MSDKEPKIIKPVQMYLYNFLSKHIISIPAYQRPYSWKPYNIDQLWGDIFNTVSFPNKEKNIIEIEKNPDLLNNILKFKFKNEHFLGNVFVKKPKYGDANYVDIIDGQQRITTIIILLHSLKRVALDLLGDDKEVDVTQEVISSWFEKIDKLLYKDDQKIFISGGADKEPFDNIIWNGYASVEIAGINNYKMNTNSNDDNEDEYDDGISFDETLVRNTILNNFKYLTTKIMDYISADDIRNYKFNNFERILSKKQVLDMLINLFLFSFKETLVVNVNYMLGNDGDTFLMFEAINARGIPLAPLDKIKNKLFYWVFIKYGESKKYEEVKNKWAELIMLFDNTLEEYIRYYLTSCTNYEKYIPPKKLYEIVIKFIEDENSKANLKNGHGDLSRNLIINLYNNRDYYSYILAPDINKVPILKKSKKLEVNNIQQQFIYMKKFKIFRPLLLKTLILFGNPDQGVSTETIIFKIIATCVNAIINFKLSPTSIGKYETSIAKITKTFFKDYKKGNVFEYNKLSDIILEYSSSAYQTMRDLISDEIAYKKSLSKITTKNFSEILLIKIERFLTGVSDPVINIGTNYSIEHIWPQTYTNNADWIDKAEIIRELELDIDMEQLIQNIGNLTILEFQRNSSVKNISYKDKIETYKKSKLKIVAELINEYTNDFDHNSIISRADSIADFIIKNELIIMSTKDIKY